MPDSRVALVVGATGLVGSFLLRRLLEAALYRRVDVWARRGAGVAHPKLNSAIIDLDELQALRVEAEDVFCCLGTTIKQAGSQPAFRHVDHDYPVALARAAARDRARRLLVVSALGANAQSRMFYNRVKGEMEQAVRAAGVPRTLLFRPSLLSGPRADVRLGENLGQLVGAALGPLLGKYRPIHGDLVAAAMFNAAARDLPSQVFESDAIRKIGL